MFISVPTLIILLILVFVVGLLSPLLWILYRVWSANI